MTFEPPSETVQLCAREAISTSPPYLLRELADEEAAWNLVATLPVATSMPGLPQLVNVAFTDGSVRVFDPEDVVLIRSVSHRAEGDRRELRELAEAHGWRRIDDGADLFTRGVIRVEVHYHGATVFTARRLREGRPTTYFTTGGGVKSAVINWLSVEPTHRCER